MPDCLTLLPIPLHDTRRVIGITRTHGQHGLAGREDTDGGNCASIPSTTGGDRPEQCGERHTDGDAYCDLLTTHRGTDGNISAMRQRRTGIFGESGYFLTEPAAV